MGNVLGRGWCCRQWVCHSPDGFHYCCNPPLHEKTGPNDRLADFVGVVVLPLARGHGDGNSLVYEASTCLQMGKFFLGATHASHLGARESWQCCDLLSKFCSSAAMAKDTGFYQPRKLCSIGECKLHSPACLLFYYYFILKQLATLGKKSQRCRGPRSMRRGAPFFLSALTSAASNGNKTVENQ